MNSLHPAAFAVSTLLSFLYPRGPGPARARVTV